MKRIASWIACALSPVLLAAAGSNDFVVADQGVLHLDATPGAYTTENLSVSGDWAAVGDTGYPPADSGVGYGRVLIYRRVAGDWTLQQQILNPRPGTGAFGRSVELDGGVLAVGNPGTFGRVHLFELSGSSFVPTQVLQGTQTVDPDDFGEDLGLDGDYLAVGAPYYSEVHDNLEGKVYVYERILGTWTLVAEFLGSQSLGQLGVRVDLSGDRFAVGAVGGFTADPNVFIYRRQGGTWSLEQQLDDHFQYGPSVSIDGDRLLVPAGFSLGLDPYHAYIYEWDGSQWSEVADLGGLGYDYQPLAAALDGERAVVGWRNADLVQIFEPLAGVWTQRAEITGDGYGAELAVDGATLLVGASWRTGNVYAYLAGPAWRSYCSGDGSASACPCANESSAGSGEGCRNSNGSGALLTATGGTSISTDDLALVASQLIPSQPALFFAGYGAPGGGAGLTFGDGLRCVGGAVQRLAILVPDVFGNATLGPGVAGTFGWDPNALRRAQVWYRDPAGGPCGSNFNLTNGLELVLVP